MNDFKDILAELDEDNRRRQQPRRECRLCGSKKPHFNTYDEWKALSYRVIRGQKAHHMTPDGAVFEKCQVEDSDSPASTTEQNSNWDWRRDGF